MIRKFIHGKNEMDLFSLVGAMAVNPDLHKKLGNAITSVDGDVWFLFLKGAEVKGFLQYRTFKNNNVHIRFLYSEDESIKKKLLKDALKEIEADQIYTYDKKANDFWKTQGFNCNNEKSRGEYIKWKKD